MWRLRLTRREKLAGGAQTHARLAARARRCLRLVCARKKALACGYTYAPSTSITTWVAADAYRHTVPSTDSIAVVWLATV